MGDHDMPMFGLWLFIIVWYLVSHADAVARMLGH